ncbi:MAG: hypothetical protein KTR27_10625 [Leptolyngbyaceae cyanobacterium MAG.088]|nr:hypothetical protein [Leptolyngbyaceae cyanobacterium MAG.088]
MGKYILLIGVTAGELAEEYTERSPAIANITALKKNLLNEVEELRDDQITTLINPTLRQMRHAIALTSYRCRHDDLCFIYYAGCGLIDAHTGKIYLAAKDTSLDAITTTAICSDYIHEALPSIQANLNRIMVLDCMWGSLPSQSNFYGPQRPVDIASHNRLAVTQLADCNCTLFTALGSHANPWPMANSDLSLYTQCLVEGITTGLADIDADGGISINDLDAYMSQALNETELDIVPITLYGPRALSQRPLLSVRPYSSEREYRRSVEEYVHHHRGHITSSHRSVLEFLRHQLGITLDQSQTIEADVIAPYREHYENCDRYRHALITALELESPLGKPLKKWLRHLQSELALSHEDVSTIEAQIATQSVAHNNSVQQLQTLPRRLTPVERPQLPAVFNPNVSLDRAHYTG